MTNINPIKFGIAGNPLLKKEDQENVANNGEQAAVQPEEKKEISSNDLLSFMAAQNVDLVPTQGKRSVDVSKYVTPEQAARIEDFMQGFEADVDEISEAALDEFPDLSQEAADSIALAFVNASY